MSSSYLNKCGYVWPIQPECFKIIGFGVYAVLIVINVIAFTLAKPVSYRRFGYLSISFFLAAVLKSLIIIVSISYGFYMFYHQSSDHILLAFVLARVFFWILAIISSIKWPSLPYFPASLVFTVSLGLLLDLLPLFSWSTYFTAGTKSDGIIFYIILVIIEFSTLITITYFPELRNEAPSAWSNIFHKITIILPYIWPKKNILLQLRIIICVFLLLIGRLINMALPLYSKWIVDGLVQSGTFQYSLIYIAMLLRFLQGNGAMGGFLSTLQMYLWTAVQQYTSREIEVKLFSHLHSLSYRWHLSRKTGLVLRIMDRGTNSVNNILSYVLFNILPTLADITIAIAFFFSIFNFYFGITIFFTMVLYIVITIYVTEWRTKFRRDMNEKENITSAIGTDSLLNYETIKYYGNEAYEIERFEKAIINFQQAEWRSNASLALLNFSQNGIIGISMTLGSLLVAYLIKADQTLVVGDYVLFTTYLLQLYSPLNFFGTVYRAIQKSFIDMENMFDLLNEEVEIRDSQDAVEYSFNGGHINVKDLSFSYNENLKVLDNISFEVSSGQSIALVGPSGSGKSTIIRLLFRLFETCEGSITFDGQDIRSLKIKSLRNEIGVVPQDTVLFNDTIRYNIRFGNPLATDAEVMEAAKAAMIHDKIMSLPNGYETVVGERGLKLSGGEKQRVAIARTILKRPQFIFLDEATSALDTHTERAIQHCLEKLGSNRTGVIVAHRLSTVVNVDCILVLDKGRIVERGRHIDLIAVKGIYYHMWESQNADQMYHNK